MSITLLTLFAMGEHFLDEFSSIYQEQAAIRYQVSGFCRVFFAPML
jgi:hypothetical protein